VAVTCGEKLGDMTIDLGLDKNVEEFVSGGPKTARTRLNARAPERKTVCKLWGITTNYGRARLVNFDNFRDMILGADVEDVITVRTDRKIKLKIRKCDGCGLAGAIR
jgi:hypothetical protein